MGFELEPTREEYQWEVLDDLQKKYPLDKQYKIQKDNIIRDVMDRIYDIDEGINDVGGV